jgi:hypothetical protein
MALRIFINDKTPIALNLPAQNVCDKEPDSVFGQEALEAVKHKHVRLFQRTLYRDPESFNYIYKYFCGYDIYFEGLGKEMLINLMSDCDFYKLSNLKAKLSKYITVNPDNDPQEIKNLISLFRSTYSVMVEPLKNLFAEYDYIFEKIELILDDDKSMNYVARLVTEKPKYEFHNPDDKIDLGVNYILRTFSLSCVNEISKSVRALYGDMYADIFEKSLPDFFAKKTSSSSWYSSVSNLFGLSFGKPNKSTEELRKEIKKLDICNFISSLLVLFKNILQAFNCDEAIISIISKLNDEVIMINKETPKEETKNTENKNFNKHKPNDIFKNVLDRILDESFMQKVVKDNYPELVTDSESSSDEYDKLTDSDVEKM